MAIKGKGKTKSRPAARAPRREPVAVPPPFFVRRWVQMTLAFVAGFLVMVLVVWVTDGLRQQDARSAANADASSRRTAALKWQHEVEGTLGKLGNLTTGAAPTILTSVGDTITSMGKGSVPKGAAATLKQAGTQAQTAGAALQKFALSDAIRNQGFDVGQVDDFLNSQSRLVEALQLYQQAAAIGATGAGANGPERTQIVAHAAAVKSLADQALQEGWSAYQQALADGGIAQSPLGPTGASAGS